MLTTLAQCFFGTLFYAKNMSLILNWNKHVWPENNWKSVLRKVAY